MSPSHEVVASRNKRDNVDDAIASQSASAQTEQSPAVIGESHPVETTDEKEEKPKDDDQPAGGFDATLIPTVQAGYTVKFTFHRATNLPIADIQALSSDPYLLAQINTNVPTRHKEDPLLRFRTHTVHKSTEPDWNEEWIVANIPASGFRLKLRVYDEDPTDADDRLGNVSITVDAVDEKWEGQKEQAHKIQPRAGSKRAYAIRSLAKCFGAAQHLHGLVYVSMQVMGRTEEIEGQNGRLYTIGPCRWIQHFSPMLGRLANIKDGSSDEDEQHPAATSSTATATASQRKKKVQTYNFQANQMQLAGPVPAPLYHRFVEFKAFVKRMFTASGISGFLLSKALHHQHSRVYNFSRDTVYGSFPGGPCPEMTRKFLELVHWDKGGRIFTYVLTLDALFRFTETGKEFSIDMLSKHTMHSDVSIYIAFSGEFFVRRLKHPRKPPPPEPMEKTTYGQNEAHDDENTSHPPTQIGDSGRQLSSDSPQDPSYYELVIDNDSGTYRPNAKLLPLLQKFLSHSFPGLHIQVLDCQKDAEKMKKMKDEQRERKKKEGDHILVMQGSRSSSFSSSDDEGFERLQREFDDPQVTGPHERGLFSQATKDARRKQQAKWEKLKREGKHVGHHESHPEAAIREDGHKPEDERGEKEEEKGEDIGQAGPSTQTSS